VVGRPSRKTVSVPDDDLLAEQKAFYRRRAPEYDQWWQRRGPYDRGPEVEAQWQAQVDVVAGELAAFGARGDVLELAGGTGWWTERLAATSTTLTVVDSSPEALEINRERVGRRDVEYITADLFTWEPAGSYDVVFFSFWLSHVPRQRVAGFFEFVASCLREDGRAFLIDNRTDPFPEHRDPHVLDARDDVQRRSLSDGSEHRVVKVMYEPDDLAQLLSGLGWEAEVGGTRWLVYGSAQRAATRAL
jgi:SAM-dependent methyltransferase